MTEISTQSAKKNFGISTSHEQMPNGECRFRLRKVDGTAYIRTEAATGSGWQNSHFHGQVMETYIVQQGWMAFAELIGTTLSLCIYRENEIVTSRPGVVHNVFLPEGAVIHTVKHGNAAGADWLTDERTAAFDKVTRQLATATDVCAAAIIRTKKVAYSEEYRHFDTLIWQVPAWSTGIFAISIQALFAIFGTQNHLALTAGATLSLLTAACLACFSFVMMRFRVHQRGLKGYSATKAWLSASTLTQCLITIESASLLCVSFLIFDMKSLFAVLISALTALALVVIFERQVRRAQIRC